MWMFVFTQYRHTFYEIPQSSGFPSLSPGSSGSSGGASFLLFPWAPAFAEGFPPQSCSLAPRQGFLFWCVCDVAAFIFLSRAPCLVLVWFCVKTTHQFRRCHQKSHSLIQGSIFLLLLWVVPDNSNVYFQVVFYILLPAVRNTHTNNEELQRGVGYLMTIERSQRPGMVEYSANEHI